MAGRIFVPEGYKAKLGIIETEIAIKKIKDFFQKELAKALNLTRVSAPLFVRKSSGLNDDLSGDEEPVGFNLKNDGNSRIEIVHSLAKWKRLALKKYGFKPDTGVYTDMNAIRAEEEFDNTHSIYVDQWDWERVITEEERNLDFLKDIVRKIYGVFLATDKFLDDEYEHYKRLLPDEVVFIDSQDLEDMYPDEPDPERREALYSKEKKAIFVLRVGHKLKSGKEHGKRSPDYDDWNLNGDLIFWNPILNKEIELSSMGIRVDPKSMDEQLKIANCEERKNLRYHKMLLNNELPLTIGGGIGQSRICMFFLQKAHIGEVQSSVWPKRMREECKKYGINLL
ncbi:MAG: aspartate--ammonia ligase [Andreesenia angusta]|nr:aspartate--ammonia ligase [Andreesenia angusta]